MAWELVCKNAFCERMRDIIRKGSTVNKALKKLAKELDIPFKTLERWWYTEDKPEVVEVVDGETGEILEGECSLKTEGVPHRGNQIKGVVNSLRSIYKRMIKLNLSDEERDQIKPHIQSLIIEVMTDGN